MDPHHFGNLDPHPDLDPHQIRNQDPDPHQIENQNPDPHPDLHQRDADPTPEHTKKQ